MQQINRNKPTAGVLNGIKIVIASGAIAGAVGIWSMLAGKALANSNLQEQDQGNTGLTELPTLVPITVAQNTWISPVVSQSSTGLRSVTAPSSNLNIQAAPVIETVIINAPSGGGGGGGGKKAAARTGSSR